jgi:hypothetical protein
MNKIREQMKLDENRARMQTLLDTTSNKLTSAYDRARYIRLYRDTFYTLRPGSRIELTRQSNSYRDFLAIAQTDNHTVWTEIAIVSHIANELDPDGMWLL